MVNSSSTGRPYFRFMRLLQPRWSKSMQDLVQHEHSNRKTTSNRSLKITHGEVIIDRKSIFQAHAALITPVEQVKEYMLVLCFIENIGETVIYQWVEALREFLQDKYVSSNNLKLVEDVEDSSSKKLSNTNSLKITNRSLKITHGELVIDRKSIFQAHAALITPVEQALREFLQDKYVSSNNIKLVEDVEDSSSKQLSNTNSLKITLDFLQNKYSSSQNCIVQDLVQHELSNRKTTSNRSLKITHSELVIDRKSIFQVHAALITPLEQALREFLQDLNVSSNNFKLVEDVEDSSSKKLSNTNSSFIYQWVEALRDFLQNKYSSSQNCVVQDLVQHELSNSKTTSNRSLKITHGELVIDRKSIFQVHAALITPPENHIGEIIIYQWVEALRDFLQNKYSSSQNCVLQDLVQHEHSNRKTTSNTSLKITHGEVVIDRKSIFQAHAALITPVEQPENHIGESIIYQWVEALRDFLQNKYSSSQNCVVQDLVQHEHSNRKTTSNRSLKITHGEVVIDRKSIFQVHAALITPVEQVK
ncbi:hypothetical protein J6590_065418 [Homalodisca vitripennis]|nr:hypothetical protein J6590_065418 [Homalodisca vitripennis]